MRAYASVRRQDLEDLRAEDDEQLVHQKGNTGVELGV